MTLREVVPAVVRVLDVPAASTLGEVHDLLQVALGWTDSHLHQFVTDEAVYSVPSDDDWEEVVDERDVMLAKMPPSFRYDYDFGDGWEHDVEVVGPGGDEPALVSGEGACPPEDCGGPHGYGLLLEALADVNHPDHQQMRDWVGELPSFDLAAAHDLLVQTVGVVPASVRLLLDLLANGVKLTPRGRLPRAFVQQFQQHRPEWDQFGGPARSEEDVYPLFRLHEALRGAGLLRISKGLLRPTKASVDDLEVLRRLRTWLAKDPYQELLLGDALALLIARGPMRVTDLAAEVLPMLGYSWHTQRGPLTADDVRTDLRGLSGLLTGLDLIVDRDDDVMHASPTAALFLPRATGLANYFA